MDSTTGNPDKNKKDDAAAVVTTTMKRGPPPPASLYPHPPFGMGQVRCSLCVDVRLLILIDSARPPLFWEIIVHHKTGCNVLNQLGAHMQTTLIISFYIIYLLS
jgi:hypothetical protein